MARAVGGAGEWVPVGLATSMHVHCCQALLFNRGLKSSAFNPPFPRHSGAWRGVGAAPLALPHL